MIVVSDYRGFRIEAEAAAVVAGRRPHWNRDESWIVSIQAILDRV
jgi:hypothetical protein